MADIHIRMKLSVSEFNLPNNLVFTRLLCLEKELPQTLKKFCSESAKIYLWISHNMLIKNCLRCRQRRNRSSSYYVWSRNGSRRTTWIQGAQLENTGSQVSQQQHRKKKLSQPQDIGRRVTTCSEESFSEEEELTKSWTSGLYENRIIVSHYSSESLIRMQLIVS